MFALIKRYRELLVVSALLLFPFVMFMARGQTPRAPNFLDRTVIAISSPVQSGIGWIVDGIASGWHGYIALRGVKAENDRLRTENSELHQRLQSLTEAEQQNQRLRALLAYTESNLGAEVTARIIGVNPQAWPLSIRLDRGEDNGVRKGAAVITADGVVGQVIRVTGGYSDVMLVTDPSSRIAVRLQRTRARGTAAGVAGDKPLALENVLRTVELQEGDEVITAGTDGVFPPGLTVGKVTNIQQKTLGMFQAAEVVPAVDISRLEEVLVLPRVEWTPANGAETGTGTAQAAEPRGATP